MRATARQIALWEPAMRATTPNHAPRRRGQHPRTRLASRSSIVLHARLWMRGCCSPTAQALAHGQPPCGSPPCGRQPRTMLHAAADNTPAHASHCVIQSSCTLGYGCGAVVPDGPGVGTRSPALWEPAVRATAPIRAPRRHGKHPRTRLASRSSIVLHARLWMRGCCSPTTWVLAHGRPHGGLPQDGLPQDGLPQDGLPQDGLPQDGLPQGGLLRYSCAHDFHAYR